MPKQEEKVEEPLITMDTIYEKADDGEYVIKGLKIVDKKHNVCK